MIDLDKFEGQIRGARYVRSNDVLSLIAEVRHLQVMASANQGAIVNSIIERTQGEPSDAQVSAALESYWGYPDGYSRGMFEKMRATLRAAWEVVDG